MRAMVVALTPAMSAASSQVIFFAMAFKITSWSFMLPPLRAIGLPPRQKTHLGIPLIPMCGSLAVAFQLRIGALRRSLGVVQPRQRKMGLRKASRRIPQVVLREIPRLGAARQQATEQELRHGVARLEPDCGLRLG